MIKRLLIALAVLFSFSGAIAQNEINKVDRLKVFVDCSNSWCDMNFIRTEINLVDFMLDRVAADVHLLLTQQRTGSGGSEYQLIFFGQNSFKNLKDTIRFNTDPNATDFERRDLVIKYMQLGLAPFVAKTKNGAFATISFKREQKQGDKKDSAVKSTKDPWNYWVYKIGANGYFQKDANFKFINGNLNLDVNRVTDKLKVGFEVDWNDKTQIFSMDTSTTGATSYKRDTIKNDNYNLEHFLIKTLAKRWSWAYLATYSKSDYSNSKGRAQIVTGIEYAIFPYNLVNTKFFTIAYMIDARHNTYIDTTIFNKTKEWLFGQSIRAKLTFNQKWGTISVGSEFHQYLHNLNFYNLNMYANINVRITGGLSINFDSFGELSKDQVFLSKNTPNAAQILTRQRQLPSGYFVYASFGINYRFGSKLNNFVNPRFD